MLSARSLRNCPRWHLPRCSRPSRGYATEADVDQARRYCFNQLRTGDYEAYLIRRFIPAAARDAYDALRTLNLELARLPESVTTPTVGHLRMQFWKDAVERVFADRPLQEPISILLHDAVAKLAMRDSGLGTASLKFWLLRFINTRERYMDLRPFPSLAALEDYAENTYASLMYLTVAFLPLRSAHIDHIASHIGKSCGIVAVLRGVPILSAPPRPIHSPKGVSDSAGRKPVLLLPLDVLAEDGVREEDVFRRGPDAPGLQDAIFRVATRANDHLATARELLGDLRAGKEPAHAYEHGDEPQHVDRAAQPPGDDAISADIQRAFGIFLDAIPAQDFLARLQGVNFDPFAVRSRSWKLPWAIWQALKRQQI